MGAAVLVADRCNRVHRGVAAVLVDTRQCSGDRNRLPLPRKQGNGQDDH